MNVRRLGEINVAVLVLLASLWIAWPVTAQDNIESIQVGVVVQSANKQLQTFCVTLDGDTPTGADALQATGLSVTTAKGTLGTTVCRIGNEGCTPPNESCFCQCEGGETCAYWAYFHGGEQGGWQYSTVGSEQHTVSDGDVEGWWWRDSADSDEPLPFIPFETICSDQADFPRVVTDGLGREVVLETRPQRIASVTLGSDEILLDLVDPDRLLGVTYFASDPTISNIADRLQNIERTDLIGNPELLISLEADLVILASYSNPAALDQLLDAGVPVFVLTTFETLDDIRENIRLLGRATGEEVRAEALITQMDSALDAVQVRTAGQEPVRVLYYEPGGITYGPGSTVDEIITLAGGVNVVAEADMGASPLVNAEFVLTTDPDVVLVGAWFSSEKDPVSWFVHDPVFSTLRAVQNQRVYAVNDAHMTNVSHYFALGVEDVASLLYPDVFGEDASE